MILFELTNRIEKALYLDDEEKKELLAEIQEMDEDKLEILNEIFIDTDNEFEVMTQASDFALAGFMEVFNTMNDLELKNIENGGEI